MEAKPVLVTRVVEAARGRRLVSLVERWKSPLFGVLTFPRAFKDY